MSQRVYRNPWMPQSVIDILTAEKGSILDVGGGAAPYSGAAHIVDIAPFDSDRLLANAWGEERRASWSNSQYTEFDICSHARWPFSDKAFALGLCSHTLEDLRDPLPVLAEMGRVCQNILIVTPSRLLEQTQNIDHPRYCGFSHHPWIVFADSDGLVFRRKTAYLNFPGCHFTCPDGQTYPVELGTFVYYGSPISGREQAYWSGEEEVGDYQRFVRDQGSLRRLFIPDRRPVSWKKRVYRMRRRFLGVP